MSDSEDADYIIGLEKRYGRVMAERDELKREVESHLEVERLGLKVHRDAMAVICKQYEEQKAKAEKYEKALREIKEVKHRWGRDKDCEELCDCPEETYKIAAQALSESDSEKPPTAAQEGEK